MTEPRKSYMSKEQLESYLANLRNNRPQRPTGARPLSSSAKSRWSIDRSSTAPLPSVTPGAEPYGVPTLRAATPTQDVTRRESRLLRKSSHKRANTISSILSIGSKHSKEEQQTPDTRGWDGVDLQDGRMGDVTAEAVSSARSSVISPRPSVDAARPSADAVAGPSTVKRSSSLKKRDSTSSSRDFAYTARLVSGTGRSQSVSSGSSRSSANSGTSEKKRVSWNLPPGARAGSPPPVVMPPAHPPSPLDRSKIEEELTEHFGGLSTSPTSIAPLRITKSASVRTTPGSSRNSSGEPARLPSVPERSDPSHGRREYGSPYPPRQEYVEPWKQEPTQHNKVHYTTNPDPLPSPPMSGSESEDTEEAEILKGLGRRPLPKTGSRETTPPEERVRGNQTKYGAQVSPPSPPVIGVVTQPSPPPSAPRVTLSSTQSAPVIPTICVPDDEEPSKGTSVPSINVPSINVPTINAPDDKGPSVPTVSEPSETSSRPLPSRRPLPRPSSVYSNSSTASNSRRGPTASCNRCRSPIEGRVVSAASLRFHPQCFRCDHCHTALEHVGFYPEPAEHRRDRLEAAGIVEEKIDSAVRFYCHLDFHELFSPRCKNCKTPIEGEVVVACGATWHTGHFFCAECGDPFDSNSRFVEKDGYAWCVKCYTNRYSGRCKKCRKPVTETVVKALGGEWHEECFVCSECSACFDDGRFFVRGGEGREIPVCVKCEEKRLKAAH